MFSASRGGGQDSLLDAGSNQPPRPLPPAVHLSLKGLDGDKTSPASQVQYPPDPLRSIWKCCGSGRELICPWTVDINLDRAGVLKYLNLFIKSRSRAQPEMVADWPPERKRERTHAVSDICAVVYMVLVKCVWMPTPSSSCRLWNATKSRDVLKSFLGALQCCFFLKNK